MTPRFIRTAVTATLALAFTAPAFAHASISPSEVVNFTTVRAAISIGHGCDGEPTTGIRVTIPEGFVSAQPMAKPGWEVAVKEGQYAATYSTHAGDVSSGAVEISWSGGNLPSALFDEFVFTGTMQAFNDQSLFAFPVTQFCAGGKSVRWDEVPVVGVDPHSLKHPAPTMVVSNEALVPGHADMMGMDMGAASAIAGGIVVSDAFVRATLPNAPVGGGYLTILNRGTEPDRLLSATSRDAGAVELHQMSMDGDVMTMSPVEGGIEIPPNGGVVQLSPGGLHLMFMDLRLPFVEGETVQLGLTFEKAGSVTLEVPVGPTAADGPPEDHSMHGM